MCIKESMNTDGLQKKKTPQCQGAKPNREFDEEIRNNTLIIVQKEKMIIKKKYRISNSVYNHRLIIIKTRSHLFSNVHLIKTFFA